VDARLPIDGLAVTGRYDKDALPKVIEGCGANVFLFPSIWPETFSYVVAELMQMDVRVACFDLGAPADRVRTYSKGCILPDNDPDAILERLVQMHKNIH
jgi:glycosyltransferase involved in cell wall biosynthesis